MKQETNEKLKKRCEVLRIIILSIDKVYNDEETSNDQKKLIETMIGAALWYLPHGEKYWTGKVSRKALDMKVNDPNINLTKDHQFPRKKAAEELLNEKLEKIAFDKDLLFNLYEEKYAQFNYVYSKENRALTQYQNKADFNDPKVAYRKAGVDLINVTPIEMKEIKKGNTKVIKQLLQKFE